MIYRFLFLSLLGASLLPSPAKADWGRFRGPNGGGLAESGTVPVQWSDAEKLWSVEIPGMGQGSPVVSGNRIFLLSAIPAEESGKKIKRSQPFRWVTICLDRETGRILWEESFEEQSFSGHKFNTPASSTAAVDGERVVFAWGTKEKLTLVSLDHDGQTQWKNEYGPVVGGHGFAGSPILYKGLVILNNDQEKQNGNLFAVHVDSGKVAWTVKRKSERISYSVPCLYPTKDHGDVLVFTNWQHGFTAIQPETGEVVADKSVFNTSTNERAISSPFVVGDLVIGTCGFTANPKHCVAMRLTNGVWEEVWRIERNVPHIPSPIGVGGRIFLIDDAGIATALQAATGNVIWKARINEVEGKVFGSPVSDGTNLFFADESGNVHVIAAADEYRHLAINPLGEGCKTTPAIVDGTLYIRTDSHLHAIRSQ